MIRANFADKVTAISVFSDTLQESDWTILPLLDRICSSFPCLGVCYPLREKEQVLIKQTPV